MYPGRAVALALWTLLHPKPEKKLKHISVPSVHSSVYLCGKIGVSLKARYGCKSFFTTEVHRGMHRGAQRIGLDVIN